MRPAHLIALNKAVARVLEAFSDGGTFEIPACVRCGAIATVMLESTRGHVDGLICETCIRPTDHETYPKIDRQAALQGLAKAIKNAR